MVRYMDDAVFWCDSREHAQSALALVRAQVAELRLELHPRVYLQRSHRGLSFLGYRVFADRLRLSRRRQVRYRRARQEWEQAYASGELDGPALQAGYASALATVAHADSHAWRSAELARRPPLYA